MCPDRRKFRRRMTIEVIQDPAQVERGESNRPLTNGQKRHRIAETTVEGD